MNKQTKEIKDILKLHGVTLSKPSGEWIVRIKIDGFNQDVIYIMPEMEDGEFLRIEELECFNKILFFEISHESFSSRDNDVLSRHLSAVFLAIETLKSLNIEWKGRDLREFAKVNIYIKK